MWPRSCIRMKEAQPGKKLSMEACKWQWTAIDQQLGMMDTRDG